jgi:hypothetical protein
MRLQAMSGQTISGQAIIAVAREWKQVVGLQRVRPAIATHALYLSEKPSARKPKSPLQS